MIHTLSAPHRRQTHRARVGLLGLGTASPAGVSQAEAASHCEPRCCDTDEQRQFLHRIFSHSGVDRRGSVLIEREGELDRISRFYPPRITPGDPGPTTQQRMALYAEAAPALALRAARSALDSAGLDSTAITHLITVSCTGFFAPGLDCRLIDDLGLSADVSRLHLGFMGCHGAFNALAAARQIARGDLRARILVCCVELCTLHLAYGFDPQKLVANALFADGAAAAVVGRAGRDARWQIQDCASQLIPDSADAMTWSIGDHGFAMTLSPRVPELVRTHIGPWLGQWLAPHHLSAADIQGWAIHPGGPRVLTAVADAAGFPHDRLAASRRILARHGNMSSATILFVLDELSRTGASGACVALGFGPGLMAEGMLLAR